MEQETVEDIEDRPNPSDFDSFMPWACKEYYVQADVVVSRAFQEVYVGAAATTSRKYGQKKKLSIPASFVAQDPHEEDQSSEIENTVAFVPENKVKIETVYDSRDNLVQVKFLRNKKIPRKVMQVLKLTIPFQQHLTSITINSGLRIDSLYELSKCLPNSQITELCLDGTSLNQGHYNILLTQGKLKHLSLARCSLNDNIIEMIVEQLKDPCPAAKVLSALNLSSNRITDIGAKHLADMLRTNRQLSYLNIASNMITDEGGVTILNTLQKFPLKTREILESRASHAAFLAERNDLINTFIMELQTSATGKNGKRKTPKRAKLESPSIRQQNSLAVEAHIIREKAVALADNKLGKISEPFSLKNTESHNGVIHCLGNNTLCYLNIAYTNLTYVTIKKLVEVLTVQKSLNRSPRGLIKVLIEGNSMPEDCTEFKEIEYLLATDSKRLKSQVDVATRKKPMSAKFCAR